MRKYACIAGLLVGLYPSFLFGRDQIGIRLGGYWGKDVSVNYPTEKVDDFDEDLRGFLLGLELDIYLLNPLALVITADYSEDDVSMGNLDLWMGAVGLKYNLLDEGVRPYIGGDVGLLYYDFESNMAYGRGTEFFLRGKVGLSVEITDRLELFAEGSYRYVPDEVVFQRSGRRHWIWPDVTADLSAFEALGGIRIGL